MFIPSRIQILFLLTLALIVTGSCKKEVSGQTVVYSNDFETKDLSNITYGTIENFNGTNVLGRYNNGFFNLNLSNLPKHDLLQINFDLYIHDSWDGDKMAPDGPDIWQMAVDKGIYIYTTFCNDDCNNAGFCNPQAYPNDYPNNNHNPKTGAYATNFPGACAWIAKPNGTTLYKISKTINHTNSTVMLQCLDHLVQTNAPDPKCDESWSVDNIQITAIKL